jgi:hypothetical protein
MRSIDSSIQRRRPIAHGGGRLAGFLAGSAALGSLIIALLVLLGDLDDEPEDGFDEWDDGFDEDPGPGRRTGSAVLLQTAEPARMIARSTVL